MPPKTETDEPETPKYATAEEVQKMLNGALAALRKDHEKEISELKAKLAAPREEPKPPPDDEEKKTLTKRVKELEERDANREKKLAEQAAKLRDKHASSTFEKAWTSAKLDAAYVEDHLAGLKLKDQIKVDDDERVFVGTTPVDEYVKEFAKSERGARYQSARPAGGTGSGRPSGGKPPTGEGPPSLDQAKGIATAALLGRPMPGSS